MKINTFTNFSNTKNNYVLPKQQEQVNFCANPIKRLNKIAKISIFSLSMAMFHPSAMSQDFLKSISFTFNNNNKLTIEALKDSIKKLNIVIETNFRGGKIFKFDSASIVKLKHIIQKNPEEISYSAPITNSKDVYLCNFGLFGAKRPQGRPHMGLDIFVTPYGRKPKKPVTIQSPIEGVIISSKKANDSNNVISNAVTVLGVDGKKYSFDHMARKEDYLKEKIIPLPEVGQIIKQNDTLGYVGNTGETDLWHLHLTVMTDEELKKQLADPKWIKLSKKSQYTPLNGQVNPLNENEAGKIALFLNQYRKID